MSTSTSHQSATCHGSACGIRPGDRVVMRPGDVTGTVVADGGVTDHQLSVRLETSGAIAHVPCQHLDVAGRTVGGAR